MPKWTKLTLSQATLLPVDVVILDNSFANLRPVLLWRDGLTQHNYRMGDMGCPADLPDVETAIKYVEQCRPLTAGNTNAYYTVLDRKHDCKDL